MTKRTTTRQQPKQLAAYHSARFRRVGNGFPRMVAAAYGGDIAKALADDDDQVFAKVRAWQKREGHQPENLRAIAFEAAIIDAGYDPDDLRGLIDDVVEPE
ncbi:hypothetical protein [Bradyrhizobium japonicum]|uniref:hypothetical protein n=1 Tax=Bradyrhizobium japonicum TaxID=375 RepID=UPI001E5901DA|nr:hypothetical protein [Bradyrhizobium japonicum]MCD9821622.1 hypothetical protein [Bradyrhizobium japonicum]MEB2678419.1 hypothetical protein [Bradyrhizobium japonicum]WRI88655.1 hypothetical protein R3F75_43685 [Bradyrhizobium japonicum]